jgi:flagellar biosynthesis/type III secretory pathway chaperone
MTKKKETKEVKELKKAMDKTTEMLNQYEEVVKKQTADIEILQQRLSEVVNGYNSLVQTLARTEAQASRYEETINIMSSRLIESRTQGLLSNAETTEQQGSE